MRRVMDNPSYFAVPSGDAAASVTTRDEVDAARVRGAPVRAWPDGSRSLQRRPRQPESPRRRDFRALLRTLSAREGGFEDDQGFLQGNPRPGDVAPEEFDSFSMRIKSGKISSTVSTSDGPKERQEVFYTLPLQGRRRHSVGGYLAVGGAASPAVRVTAVPSEVPSMPPPRVAAPSANTNSVKRRKIFNFREMEDIAILWSRESPESELWADYLVTCFDKIMSQRVRHHYRVTPVAVEDLIGKNASEQLQKISKSQLQIIIICPKLAEKMSLIKQEVSIVENFFKTDKVLVMLLGVAKEDILSNSTSEYPGMEEWQMMEVKEKDMTFVDNFLTAAVGILRTKDCKDPATEKTAFSIVPKKVKMGQSRIIALLNEPAREEDSIKIIVDKKGEAIQIPSFKRRNPYTLQFDIPDSCLEVSMLVWIRISKNGQSLGRRQIKCESRLRELDQILRSSDHPLEFMCQTLGFKTSNREQLDSWLLSAFQKNIPPHFNLLASSDEYNPQAHFQSGEEYPTLLHFAARHGLEKLSWQLLECPGGDAACDLRNVRHLTPADLARAAGFAHLALVLKGHMQMNEFSNMYYYLKNMTENTKDDDAASKDANGIDTQDDLRIVEVGDSDEKMVKGERQPSTDLFSEECLQSLETNGSIRRKNKKLNLPLIKIPNKDILYQNDIVFPNSDGSDRVQRAIEHDYLVQPSNIKVETHTPKFRPNNLYVNSTTLSPRPSEVFLYSPTEEMKLLSLDTPTSDIDQSISNQSCSMSNSGSTKSRRETSTPLTGQDELAEIINDFKNNVFSISEVEKLVMEWRNRNETQQSLKEKQEQLKKMREEYDRLQQKIKENLKRPTPFDRVKKLFSKGKSKQNDKENVKKRSEPHRPNSSLSESSSSSGRLSTVSGGSVCDSNMQTEFEDNKRISNNASTASTATFVDIDTKLDDYLIPPPPRPLSCYPPVTMTTFGHSKMATIAEKEPSQAQDNGTHMRMSFDSVCRSNSPPDSAAVGGAAHVYINVNPSEH